MENQPTSPPNSADEVILQMWRDDAIFDCALIGAAWSFRGS